MRDSPTTPSVTGTVSWTLARALICIEATWKHVKVQLSPYNRKTQYIFWLAEHKLGGGAARATWIP
jgi:hypothetical protein